MVSKHAELKLRNKTLIGKLDIHEYRPNQHVILLIENQLIELSLVSKFELTIK